MKITKHQVDQEGLIHIQNAVRLLTMGIQNNIVTIWAVTDPMKIQGIVMTFHVKNDEDQATVADCNSYITSFINEVGVWHLFGEDKSTNIDNTPGAEPMGRILR